MTAAHSLPLPDGVTPARLASGLGVLAGLLLASFGGYTQYTISRALATSPCQDCPAWDPQFVLAPLGLGTALVALGSYTLARTTC
jgi:hypothetical protein